ncbi:MAG: 30S ribosomal protein S8 [bacterium]|nr:30S ribosomal protein S8 [bacterium]
MAITDPIADMFTRIRNALQEKHEALVMPHSNIKASIAKILKEEGFIKSYEKKEKSKLSFLKIVLKYDDEGIPVLSKIKRVSKPGKRIYVQKKNVPKVLNGFGISLLSTSKGILSGREARLNNVGGELIGITY